MKEITVTENAAKHIRKSLIGRKGVGLRLSIKEVGCSGMTYVYGYASEINSEDVIFEQKEVKVIVDKKNLAYIKGSILDFEKKGLSKTFKITNPNAKAICGCGESFTVEENES